MWEAILRIFDKCTATPALKIIFLNANEERNPIYKPSNNKEERWAVRIATESNDDITVEHVYIFNNSLQQILHEKSNQQDGAVNNKKCRYYYYKPHKLGLIEGKKISKQLMVQVVTYSGKEYYSKNVVLRWLNKLFLKLRS